MGKDGFFYVANASLHRIFVIVKSKYEAIKMEIEDEIEKGASADAGLSAGFGSIKALLKYESRRLNRDVYVKIELKTYTKKEACSPCLKYINLMKWQQSMQVMKLMETESEEN